jgi:hypothetical protein
MLPADAEREIEKLKLKKTELTNKINLTNDFDEKEILERQLSAISSQIKLLEKLKGK